LTQGADVWNAFVGAVNGLKADDSDPVLVMQRSATGSML